MIRALTNWSSGRNWKLVGAACSIGGSRFAMAHSPIGSHRGGEGAFTSRDARSIALGGNWCRVMRT